VSGNNAFSISRQAFVGKLSVEAVSFGLQGLIEVAALVIFARLVSRQAFGVFAIASGIRFMALKLSEAGVGAAVVQRNDADEGFCGTAFWLSTVLALIAGGIVFLLAPLVARFNGDSAVRSVVRATSVTFLFNGLCAVPRSVLVRRLAFGKLMACEVIPRAVGTLALGVALARLGYGVWALVWGVIAVGLLRTVFLFLLSGFVPRITFSFDSLKRLFNFSLGISLARVFHSIGFYADKFVLGHFMSVTILGGISRMLELVRMLALYYGHVLDTVSFPVMSRFQDDTARVGRTYERLVDSVCGISPFVIVASIIFARDIVRIVLGSEWLDLTPVFQAASGMFLFLLVAGVNDSLLKALGRVYLIAVLKVIAAVSCIGAILLSYRHGQIAVTWGIVLGNALPACVGIVVCSRLLGQNPWAYLLHALRTALVMALLLIVLERLSDSLRWSMTLPYATHLVLRTTLSFLAVSILIILFPFILGNTLRELLVVIFQKYIGRAHYLAGRFAPRT